METSRECRTRSGSRDDRPGPFVPSTLMTLRRIPSVCPRPSASGCRRGACVDRIGGGTIERPGYVWFGIASQIFVGIMAVPVGFMMIVEPNGSPLGIPNEWVADSAFGSFLVPGLFLLLVIGVGQLLAAALAVIRHPLAPWLMGALGVGLLIWIVDPDPHHPAVVPSAGHLRHRSRTGLRRALLAPAAGPSPVRRSGGLTDLTSERRRHLVRLVVVPGVSET